MVKYSICIAELLAETLRNGKLRNHLNSCYIIQGWNFPPKKHIMNIKRIHIFKIFVVWTFFTLYSRLYSQESTSLKKHNWGGEGSAVFDKSSISSRKCNFKTLLGLIYCKLKNCLLSCLNNYKSIGIFEIFIYESKYCTLVYFRVLP